MIFFWNLIIHALIIACTLGLVFFVFVAIKTPEHAGESLLRLVAAAIGFLICMGAKVLGLSIPELIFNAGIYRISPWNLLIPFGVGAIVTAIFVEAMLTSETILSRVIILLSVFIITAFADTYIASYAVESNKFLINKALMPNLLFIIGVAGYAIFNVDPKKFKN